MDKRKVTCFLLLVVIGLACVCAILYMLFYARPHADQEIQKDGRSALHAPSMQPAAAALTVHS